MKGKILTRREKIQVALFFISLAAVYVPFGAVLGWGTMLVDIGVSFLFFVGTVVLANIVWCIGINFDWWW